MSRYHPLDVRHPDNRDLRRRNFLLDPPAGSGRTRTARRRDSDQHPVSAETAAPEHPASGKDTNTRSPFAPWGGRPPEPPTTAPVAPQDTAQTWPVSAANARRGIPFRLLFIVALIGIMASSELRDTLYDLPLIGDAIAAVADWLRRL